MKSCFYIIGFMTVTAFAMLPDERHPNGLSIPGASSTDTSPRHTPVGISSLSTRNIDTHDLESLIRQQIIQGLPSRLSTYFEQYKDKNEERELPNTQLRVELQDAENQIKGKIDKLNKTDKEYTQDLLRYTRELATIKIALVVCSEVRIRHDYQIP